VSDRIDLEEEERREKELAELRKPIKLTDSAGLVAQKCYFQDSVKYEFVPPDQDFIDHLLPSRRRS